MTISQFPSLQGLPIEPPPGYFDPTTRVWGKVGQIWDDPEQSKVMAIALAAIGVLVTTLNAFVTMPAALVGFTRLNNALDEELRSLTEGVSASKYKVKRLNYEALNKLAETEMKNIVNGIFEANDATGMASPFQLAAAKMVIFSEMSDLIDVPEAFWTDLLRYTFDKYGALIQTGIDQIEEILNNPESLNRQLGVYLGSIQTRIAEHGELALKKNQREQQIAALKQELNNNPPNAENLKKQIVEQEKKISALTERMDQLVSKEDLKALESWPVFRDRHFTHVVKQKLEQRKAFLKSIKEQKDLYVGYTDKPTSWTKVAFVGLAAIGAVAAGLYVYNNGVPSTEELSSMASGAYKKATDAASYTWENIPSVEQVKTGSLDLWEKATWENISKTSSEYASYLSESAKQAWNATTV